MHITPLRTAIVVGVAVAILDGRPATVTAQSPSRERTMFVSAVDAKGEPVEGLSDDAFVIREDGVRREVIRVSRATEPIDVAVLVDNSAAMSPNLTLFREGVTSFVERMGSANAVALISLADRPTIVVDYSRDPEQLGNGARRVFPMTGSGMTLLDAVIETARGLTRRESPRAVIVPVLTDGPEFTNRYHRDVIKTLVDGRIAMHAVTVGQFLQSDQHAIRERAFFLEIGARDTGGQRIFLLTAHGLNAALQRLARELAAQYKVVYVRPDSLIPPQKATVSSGRSGVTMRGTSARGE